MNSPDLSTLTRDELEARCLRMERLAREATRTADIATELLAQHRAENRAMSDVLARQVVEHSDLRMQLAEVTPFSALAALLHAPGWQTTMPTIEEIEAHAEAFPYGPSDGEDDNDPDAEMVGGLWAFRDASGVGLVELYRGRHREPWMMYAGADALRAECDLASWNDDERILGWLRLTADGRPVRS